MIVRVRLERSSEEFLAALGGMIAAVECADGALLEDSIAEAHERLVRALRDPDAIGFSTDGDEGWEES